MMLCCFKTKNRFDLIKTRKPIIWTNSDLVRATQIQNLYRFHMTGLSDLFIINVIVIVTSLLIHQRIRATFPSTILWMWYHWNVLHAFIAFANDIWSAHRAQAHLLLSRRSKCCFYAQLQPIPMHSNMNITGILFTQILDEVYNVLNCIRTTPNPACRPFKITEELIDLSTMAIEFFKSDLEPLMPQIGALKHLYGKGSTTTRKL